MLSRRFYGIKLYPNDILIKQSTDTEVLWHEDQSVIDEVRANVHRYHAKQKDGILYAAQLDDTDSARYVDGQPAAVSNVAVGDTLVYIPKFYATLRIERGDISVYRFSSEAINGRSFEFGDVFIGAYGGDFTNETLNSVSHPASTTGTWRTKTQLENMAAAKGTGYSAVTLAEHNLVGLLYVAIHHNTDCKGTLGAGSNTYDRPCGTSTSAGMRESTAGDVFTSFLGIENWWGGRYELLGGIVANNGAVDGIYHVTERDGSVRQIKSIAPTSQWMYPRKMILGRRFDIVADPVCYAGEITAGHGWFSEQYMRNEADRVVIRGGFQADVSSGFAFLAARFTNAESGSYNTMTGRLAYKGDHEFVEVDSYREKFDPNWIRQFNGGQITAVYKQLTGAHDLINFSDKIQGDFYMYVDGVRYLSSEGFTLNDFDEHTVVLKIKDKQTSMYRMFYDNTNLTSVDLSQFDTSLVTTMKECFMDCHNVQDVCLDKVKTLNVQDMSYMFLNCYDLKNIDCSSFDTRNAKSIFGMFNNCANLESVNIPYFRLPEKAGIGTMFKDCNKLKSVDVSNLRSENTEGISYLFSGCTSMQYADLSSFDLHNVKVFMGVFNECSSLKKVRMLNKIDPFSSFNGFMSGVSSGGTFEYDIDGASPSLLRAVPSSWRKVPIKKIEESCTWVCPQDYDNVSIFAVGGGGGGGPVWASGNNGHGGMGGFTSSVNNIHLNAGDEIHIEIGQGGIGGKDSAVGTSGGNTTVVCEVKGINITAKGGARGGLPWENNDGTSTRDQPSEVPLGGSAGGVGRVGPSNGLSNGASLGPVKSYEGFNIYHVGQGSTTAAFGEDWGCGPYYGSGGAANYGIGGSTLGGTNGINGGNGMFYGAGGGAANFFTESDGITPSNTEKGKVSGDGHPGVVLIRLDNQPASLS